jgi:RNA ligase (TIGR02306 family)
MRQLASIQRIDRVAAIAGAQAVEKVGVLGWWIVARRGEFDVGQLVVFVEIDALLPERPEFEFLRPRCFRAALRDAAGAVVQRAGFHVRTLQLCGQISQGLCLPLSVLPPAVPREIGRDVSKELGIIKYEPAQVVQLAGRVKGALPAFVQRTAEIRIQAIGHRLHRHFGKTFHLTEKLDGMSITAFHHQGQFGLCSRNAWLDENDHANVACRVAQRLELHARLAQARRRLGHDLAVQAELIGPGIHGNKYKLTQHDIFAFNVVNLATGSLLPYGASQRVLGEMCLPAVPHVGWLKLAHDVDGLVEMARGGSRINPTVPREGIVVRPPTEEFDGGLGGRLSFKVINPRFLTRFAE